MSQSILLVAVTAAQVMLALAMALALVRMVYGPRAQDRVLGLDTLYINSMLMLLVFGMRTGSVLYFEAALIIAMLGFFGTVVLSKYVIRRDIVE